MARLVLIGLLLVVHLASIARAAADPDETLRSAAKVLSEVKTTPGKQIPDGLLAQAQAVVIVPDAIKFGLIGGVRSGNGVVLMHRPMALGAGRSSSAWPVAAWVCKPVSKTSTWCWSSPRSAAPLAWRGGSSPSAPTPRPRPARWGATARL